MRASNGEMLKWFRCSLFQRPLLARASKAAFVVGTILTVLNHGERLFQSEPFPVTNPLDPDHRSATKPISVPL
jgi:hypothetical protein